MKTRLGLGLVLGTMLGSAAWAQSAAPFDGHYMGELTLTREIAGDCTRPPLGAIYPLTIAGGEVRFVYVPLFATTLVGRVNAKGAFTAAARLRKGRMVQMTGRTDGYHLTARLVSPSCHYTFQTRE